MEANKKYFAVSGISQFWTDDYKVFDHIYGKTSDKEIFGATLPPSFSYGIDPSKINKEASEKKERYINHYIPQDIDDDAYDFGDKHTELFKKQQVFKNVKKIKPTKSPFNFISTDFKPITQNNDPYTYSYLKHLEQLQKYKEAPELNVGGFKPYVNYAGANSEDTDAYTSIQDILDAHEGNKGKTKDNQDTDDQVKYLTYGGLKGTRSKKPKPRAPPPPPKIKFHCAYGRCRKRATNTYRVLTRPVVRKIKHKIITY